MATPEWVFIYSPRAEVLSHPVQVPAFGLGPLRAAATVIVSYHSQVKLDDNRRKRHRCCTGNPHTHMAAVWHTSLYRLLRYNSCSLLDL